VSAPAVANVETVYEFENGLIRRGRVYDDRAEAVSAAQALAGDGGA
jgi:hypothetical protein